MRKVQVSLLWLLLISGAPGLATRNAAASSDDGAALVGTWQGAWTGDGAGKFDMTIAKNSAGKLSGSITPKPDDGEAYTAEFKSFETAAGKFTAKFDDPGGEIDIVLIGSAEGKTARGTYTVRQKSDGSRVDSGTWTATRK